MPHLLLDPPAQGGYSVGDRDGDPVVRFARRWRRTARGAEEALVWAVD
jgi:hypothetical protein